MKMMEMLNMNYLKNLFSSTPQKSAVKKYRYILQLDYHRVKYNKNTQKYLTMNIWDVA